MILLALAIASGPLLLLSWSLLYSAQCWVLVIPLLMIIVISLAARDSVRHRRKVLADSYFIHGALLHRLMHSTKIITVGALFVSAILSVMLLARVPTWDLTVLILLALDSLFIAFLYVGFSLAAPAFFKISQSYQSIFARKCALAINVPVLLVILSMWQLQQPPPDYIDPSMDLANTMQTASAPLRSQCTIIDRLTRAAREAESFSWWLMIKGSASIDNSHLRWLAWLIFLLSGAMGFLAYTRFCVQLIHYAYVHGNR